jgi:peptide chain release factor 3
MKAKQLDKGIDQLMDEGSAAIYARMNNNRKIIERFGTCMKLFNIVC